MFQNENYQIVQNMISFYCKSTSPIILPQEQA